MYNPKTPQNISQNKRHVGKTTIKVAGRDLFISIIFLGLTDNLLLWMKYLEI